MDISDSKKIGVAFAVAAEVAGEIDVLRVQAEGVGCHGAVLALECAQRAIAAAGEHLHKAMQDLSVEAHSAAVAVAVAKMRAVG
jgi:Fe-S cluster assembly iron-binding protein IscA